MNSKDMLNAEKQIGKLNQIKSINKFINIKSDYFMKKNNLILWKKESL